MNFGDIIKQPLAPIRAMAGEDVYNNPRANDAWRNMAKGHIFDAETWKGLARASHADAVGGNDHMSEQWDNQTARMTGGLRLDQEKQLAANPGKSLADIEYQTMLNNWMQNHQTSGAYQG